MADQRISQLPVADPIDGTELLAIVQAAVTKRMPISALTTIGVLSSLTVAGNTSLGGGTFVFNDAAGDYDFRVEGTADQNLIRTDASTNNVGIGVAAPTEKLDVAGSINLATGNAIKINGTSVLDATTLGAGVVNSSLTSVGTLTSLNVSGSASLNGTTIPANSTLVTTNAAQTLTNKVIDDVSNFVGANQLHVKAKATENLVKGDVVKVTGWNAGENAIEVAKVSSTADIAFGMADSTISIGAIGAIVNTGFVEGINTNSFTVGTILYPNTTGGLTSTKPSSGLYQAVAFVLRQSTNNGTVYVEFTNPQQVEASTNTANTIVLRDGSGNFSAGTITATLNGAAPAGSLTGTTLASNVTASSLTSVGTLTSLTVSGNLTVDTNTLFVDSVANQVGIGTTSPSDPLTVQGSGNFRVSSGNVGVALTGSGWAYSSYLNAADNSFRLFSSTGGDRLTVTNSGSVGIGTTSPVAQLANTNVTDGISAANASGFAWRSTANEWAGVIISRPASGLSYGLRVHSGGTSATDYPLWVSSGAGSGSTLFGVTGAGNVGIGTATPAGRLHVISSGINSIFDSGTAADGRIELRYNGVRQGLIGFDSGIVNIRADLSSVLRLGAGNADRWSISTAGHFLAITDASFDIGASGANRPRDMYLSGNVFPAGYVQSLTRGVNGGFRLPDWFIYNTTSGNALLIEQGSSYVRINSDGNVGLGVTPSAGVKLQLPNGELAGWAGTSGYLVSNTYYGSGDFRYVGTGAAARYQQVSGAHAWLTAASGTAGAAITFTQAMTLDVSGRLAVGTATPRNIAAFTAQSSATFGGVAFRNSAGSEAGYVGPYATGSGGGSTDISLDATGFISLATAATERWRINSSGHLLAFADATYDIGASGANRPRTVFAATSIVAPTLTGTLSTAAQTNVTSVGVLTGLAVKNAATSNTDLIISGETGYAARLQFQEGNTARWYVGRGAWTGGNNYEIAGASSLLSTLDTAGNLGLGVTPSAWQSARRALQVGGSGALWANATGAGFLFLSNNIYFDGTNFVYLNTSAASIYQQATDASHRWLQAPSGTQNTTATLVETMRLDASGNLGVGTVTPATRLHVDGADGVRARISATSGGTPGLSLSSAGVVNWTLKSGNGDSSLRIDQDGTDRIWVASGGNFGIGVAATPTHPLQVRRAGGAGSLGITIDNVGIISRAVQYYAIGDATNDTTGHAFYTRNATATNNLALTIDQLTNVTVQNGNLILASATPRLQANMSGAQSSRFAFQNSTTDGNSRIFVYPNGTGNISAINFRNNSNPDAANYNSMDVGCLSTIDCRISSQSVGTNALLPLTFYMNTTEMMRLDPAGNLGLGVTPSAWGTTAKALQVDSRTAIWQQSNVSVFSNNVYAPTGGNTYIATAAATQYYQDAGAHVWRTAPSGTAGNAITFTQAMTLDASGNLAVGLTGTVGNARAAISGTVVSTTNTLSTFSGAYGGFDWSNRQLRLFSGTADATGSRIEFYTGVAGSINSRMNIDADGNVGIGVGSTSLRTEVYKLDGSGVRTDPINVMAITAESNSLPYNGYGPGLVFKSSNYSTQAPSVVARIRTSLNDNSTSSYGASLCFDTAATRGGAVSQKMALDFQGNLGVGVNPYLWFSSTTFVDVGTFTAYGQDSAGAATMTFNGYQKIVTGAWTYKTSNPAARYSCGYQGVAGHAWFVAASGSQDNNIIWGDPRMLLDASGNLGVGTTTLTYRFNAVTAAQGAAYLQGANGTFGSPNAIVRDSTHGVEICITGLSGGVGAIGTYTNHAQAFYTNTTEKARITSAGYFKASNNGIYVDAASSRHEINTNANDINLMVYCTASTSNNAMNVYSLLPSGVSSSALHFAGVISGSGLQFTVDADGDVRNTNSSYGALSDVKLKQDIVDAASQWDDIKAVRVRKYRFKRTPDAPLQIGVIAQELETVSPGLVEEVVDRDDDGNALETTTKAVKYSILYMKSVKALQEAMARIESLEARLAVLEAQP